MDAVVGVRCSRCLPATVAPNIFRKRTGSGVRYQCRRVCLPLFATLEDETNGAEALQVEEKAQSPEKRPVTSTDDVMKLFSVIQQNMLFLNKQRLAVLEELQQSQRDNDLLLARVAQLNAEYQVSLGERDLLQKKLSMATGGDWTPGSQVGVSAPQSQSSRQLDPFLIWSKLLLRIDSLALTGAMTLGQASALRNLVRKRDAQAADVYMNAIDEDDKELSSQLLALLGPNRRHGIHVVHICTEIAPIAQAGSLATYISRLCQALRRKGHLVEVILPKYASLDLGPVENLFEIDSVLFSYFGGAWHENKIWTGVLDGIAVTLIYSKHPQGFFDRDYLYDYEDDFERFTYFSRASLEYILKSGKQPNVLHIHNWQTAAIAPLFWDIYANQGLQNTRIVFTGHDFKYQCLQEPSKLGLCGLDPEQLHRADRLQDNSEQDFINILKGGIIYSNMVTIPSPLYAHDILPKELGHGLDSTLLQHQQKLTGILNGVDDFTWNPRFDPLIPATYSIEDLSGKAKCKATLRKLLKFPDHEKPRPLVGCIAPSVTDEDVEPLKTALGIALSKGAQFAFVGASKIPRIQAVLEDLQRENQNGDFAIGYTHSLAHQVLAASDILVCPCFFEPSGQWQLVAMAYGTIPVAKDIYGTRGSIIDDDDAMRGKSSVTGFTFTSTQSSDLADALTRAIDQLEGDSERWTELIHSGMTSDHTWDGKCVESYESVYYSVCSN